MNLNHSLHLEVLLFIFRKLKATNSVYFRITECLEIIVAFNVKVTRLPWTAVRGARLPSHPKSTNDLGSLLRKICSRIYTWLTQDGLVVDTTTP